MSIRVGDGHESEGRSRRQELRATFALWEPESDLQNAADLFVADVEHSRRWPSVAVRAGLAGVPFVGGTLEVLAGEVFERHRDRVTEMAAVVRQVVDDDDELLRRLSDDERLADLLIGAAEVVSRTALASKRRVMGLVVAQAVLDDAEIDKAHLIRAALSDLDAPHFRELARFAVAPPTERLDAWVIPEPIRSALVRHGTIDITPTWAGNLILDGVTSFGRELLAYVEEADSAQTEA